MTYTNLINETLELYLKEEYLKAYDFITDNSSKVKGNCAQIYNFRYAIACKAGLNELAMEILKEAIIEKGYWYSYEYLMSDEDLKPLYDYKEFEELANVCKGREIEAHKNTKPELKVLQNNSLVNNEKQSLLIALHGNEENIALTEDYWCSFLNNNDILALPQSSDIQFSDAFYWNDIELGIKELIEHYKNILDNYDIDNENIIIGGFSAGARLALYSVLKGYVKAKSMILVGPWLPEIEEWEELLDELKLKGVKAYIICGEKDEDCLEGTQKLVDMLNQREIPNIFKIVENLNHDYPINFDEELEEAVKYIK